MFVFQINNCLKSVTTPDAWHLLGSCNGRLVLSPLSAASFGLLSSPELFVLHGFCLQVLLVSLYGFSYIWSSCWLTPKRLVNKKKKCFHWVATMYLTSKTFTNMGERRRADRYHGTVDKQTGLPREVLKWLQSLDLSFFPKNLRRDFSNGFLVAELFSWYYPEDFPMHSYDNGTSLPTKQGNWAQIERFLAKQNINFLKEAMDGTIHCKPGAAELLVQEIYTVLTNRRIKGLQDREIDFTDRDYQEQLPMVARATASKAIKNNLRLTEVLAEPSISTNQRKVQAIIHMHLERRAAERAQNPKRFNVKPTLGELAVRLPPSSQRREDVSDGNAGTHAGNH
ncbi:spermatogenesis-associated protein 4 isoform X2 [Esox lucius]|uniref:spermatogenesis-associated protein 4 isoform X1 n=1 Tax=Esox lucius TaxID=8010 RepID=UPI00147751A0|nr:spermatogenesis-associated protein 4 isoform X1 [Esox lucius]XP_010898056.2 spermatogenesis-associated protein 4 isoform X2 [Esox lucius]